MNERVMQFRLGLFVIFAGLVLTMLVIWFGESPQLFRQNNYVTVHYREAPGVAEGIPVRKSGIRVGEVASIRFDDRANKPDGVLVTLALERRYRFTAGTTPRVTRALIGDVSIDLLPGAGPGELVTSRTPEGSMDPRYIIEGSVSADPATALASASAAFEKVGGTLESIDTAAKGIAEVSKKAKDLDQMVVAWRDMGKKVGKLADDFDKVVKDNEANIQPAITSFRKAADNLNETLDPKTREAFRTTASNAAAASAKFDKLMTDIGPLGHDLGGTAGGSTPTTNLGQAMMRFNRVAYEVGLLTRTLADPHGGLNTNGSLAKLFVKSDLYDNMTLMANGAREVFASARPIVKNLGRFAERIANDPSVISRGVLAR
jgi:phospholipid/cholesterol/gamma-HCH transport system substrate-binding protein